MPIALKLASDLGCHLSDEDKTSVAGQLREERGMTNISLMDSKLLVQMVVSDLSRYPPGGENNSYISSAEPLKPNLLKACNKNSTPTSASRIPLIPLFKLATYRMNTQDLWQIAYFGDVAIMNDVKMARSVKRDTSQYADAQMSMERQDIWALPTTMKSFGIFCANSSMPKRS